MTLHWADGFEEKSDDDKLMTIWKVVNLETYNSVTRDDLFLMLKWLAHEVIEEEI